MPAARTEWVAVAVEPEDRLVETDRARERHDRETMANVSRPGLRGALLGEGIDMG